MSLLVYMYLVLIPRPSSGVLAGHVAQKGQLVSIYLSFGHSTSGLSYLEEHSSDASVILDQLANDLLRSREGVARCLGQILACDNFDGMTYIETRIGHWHPFKTMFIKVSWDVVHGCCIEFH
jgi:hypothetical protein